MSLKGKTALVTGSTSGIGEACARALAAEGAQVMLNGFAEKGDIGALLAEFTALSGAEAFHNNADLAKEKAVYALVEDCRKRLGGIDILINNAGIQHVCPVDEFPVEKWRQIQAIMLDAPFLLTRGLLPEMKSRGWGRIITIASAHASVASPNKSAYVVAKHGVLGLMKTVALEVAQAGITANCISPGYVWTPLVESQIPNTMKTRGMTRDQVINDVLLASTPQRQFVTPEQVGAMAAWLCGAAAASVTGANLAMDGGWTAQ